MVKALNLPPDTRITTIQTLSQAEVDALDAAAAGRNTPIGEVAGAVVTTVVTEAGVERFENAVHPLGEIMDNELWDALEHAITKHRPMHSPHEGYAVIKHRLDELWDEIRFGGPGGMTRKRALQVAAMAIRYVLDLDPHD